MHHKLPLDYFDRFVRFRIDLCDLGSIRKILDRIFDRFVRFRSPREGDRSRRRRTHPARLILIPLSTSFDSIITKQTIGHLVDFDSPGKEELAPWGTASPSPALDYPISTTTAAKMITTNHSSCETSNQSLDNHCINNNIGNDATITTTDIVAIMMPTSKAWPV